MGIIVFRIFIVFLQLFWSRSSMDRIVDSGSIDWSSNLHGITVNFFKKRCNPDGCNAFCLAAPFYSHLK